MVYNSIMIIGFFGGAFDPLHKEHIEIIKKAKDELSLDRLILLPTYYPPHKKATVTPYELRRKMLEPYTSENIIISDYEKESKKEFNCTSDTLPKLKEIYPADKYYYIIGSDSMINFHTWIKPEQISKEATLAVVKREGYIKGLDEAIAHAKSEYGADIVVLFHKGKELSSRELRARLMLDLDVSDYIDGHTAKLIKENGLYSEYKDIVTKVKKDIPERFLHMAGTVLSAMRLSPSLDFDKVFLAALLHDIGKNRKGVPGVPADSLGTKVEHQFSSAIIAKNEYGITDPEILSAIRCHTTAKPDMSEMEMLIYLADVIEPTRDFIGVEELRRVSGNSIKQGFIFALKRTYERLKEGGKSIYPLTISAVQYYLKETL